MKLARIGFFAPLVTLVIAVLAGWLPIPVFNGIIVLIFLPLLVVGATITAVRGVRFYRVHEPLPRLLVRDIISRVGLATPLTMVLVARFLGAQPGLALEPWWVVATSIPAVISVAVYAYYEIFVIERAVRRLREEREAVATES